MLQRVCFQNLISRHQDHRAATGARLGSMSNGGAHYAVHDTGSHDPDVDDADAAYQPPSIHGLPVIAPRTRMPATRTEGTAHPHQKSGPTDYETGVSGQLGRSRKNTITTDDVAEDGVSKKRKVHDSLSATPP